MTHRRRFALTVFLLAVIIFACDTITGAVLADIPWPRTWTPNERCFAWALLLDAAAGFAVGARLTRTDRSRR